MKVSIFSLIIVFLISSACHRSISRMQLDQNLQEMVTLKRFAGFGVAIFDKDSVYFAKGYGYEDLQNQIPYSTESRQIIASVSKMFIGFALLKCQELSYLKLDDPINAYLPFEIRNPYFPEPEITIKHLATHNASFKYSEKLTDEYNYRYADSSLLFFIKTILLLAETGIEKKTFMRRKQEKFGIILIWVL